MARSRPVYAIIAAHFCENWGFYTMLTYLPQFMTDVMQYKGLKQVPRYTVEVLAGNLNVAFALVMIRVDAYV